MQTLQIDTKIDKKPKTTYLGTKSDNTSKITWQDIQGLSWIFEEY